MGEFNEWIKEHGNVKEIELNGKSLGERLNECMRGDCITIFGGMIRNKLMKLYDVIVNPEEYEM